MRRSASFHRDRLWTEALDEPRKLAPADPAGDYGTSGVNAAHAADAPPPIVGETRGHGVEL